jgi:hypothetical protein
MAAGWPCVREGVVGFEVRELRQRRRLRSVMVVVVVEEWKKKGTGRAGSKVEVEKSRPKTLPKAKIAHSGLFC